MRQLTTQAIVLSRTDFGEADRILTLLTPEYGKLRVMAKGVRRIKSKLAGGIELFSVSDIAHIKGRGDIDTLVSSRLRKHYGNIVKDIERTMLGYDLIKQLSKDIEDEPGPEYFELLQQTFEALDDFSISLELIRFWFVAQLLRLNGRSPNLQTDVHGKKLVPDELYNFDFEHMAFVGIADAGRFTPNHIKVLRLVFSGNTATVLQRVDNIQLLIKDVVPIVSQMTHS
jgi:DNA repair protein RecO (recombination protein O)